MVSFGCLGKTSRSTSGPFMYVVSTHLKCVIQYMVSGEATVLVDAKIMLLGIKTHNSD